MEDWASLENWDLGSIQDIGTVGRTEDTLTYPITHRVRTSFSREADWDKGDFFSSRLKKPRLPTRLSRHQKIMTSAVVSLDYPKRIPVRQRFRISRDAEDFINRQKKSVRYREDVFTISEKAVNFLKKQGIEAEVSVSLFTDPEYEDWIEPKIRIEVPRIELKRAYELYSDLLLHSLKGIRKRTLRKIFVTLESR